MKIAPQNWTEVPFYSKKMRSRSIEKEVILERQQFRAQLDAVGRSVASKDTACIVFTDGESHVVQTWTIEVHLDYIEYYDVHMKIGYPKIRMPFQAIARIEPYEPKQSS